MKKLKTFISLLLIIVLINGCNNQHGAKKINSTNDKVIIGVVTALTGSAAIYGTYFQKGIQMAVDEQNNKGGLMGKEVVPLVFDSKSSRVEATKVITDILAKKPGVVFAQLSPACLAIKSFTERENTMLIASCGAEKLLDSSKYIIRNYVDPQFTGETTAEEIKKVLNIEKIGIFYCDDEYGRSIDNHVKNGCEKQGIAVQFNSSFNLKENDFKVLISKQLSYNVKYIHVIGYGPSLGTFIKQLRQVGFKGLIGGDITIAAQDTKKAAGNDINGVYYVDYDFQIDSTNIAKNQFMEKYNKYTGDPANKNPFSMFILGYEGAKLYFEVVELKSTFNQDIIFSEFKNIKKQGMFCPIEIKNNNIVYKLKFNQIHE